MMGVLETKLFLIRRNNKVKIGVGKNKVMIDNLEHIKPLLNFESVGDFYMLYVFKRKKDQSTDKANHQSVRTIKTY